MFEKRGQFTIFVILGFVLVVAFVFLLFVRSFIFQDKLQAEAQRTVNEAIKNTHIDLYVESCLNRVTDDAVYLLGLQGGVLYKSQGGIYPDPEGIGKNNTIYVNVSDPYNNSFYGFLNISHAVVPNLNYTCMYINVPFYPFPNTKLDDIMGKYAEGYFNVTKNCSRESGAFGVFNLSKLCNPYGTNRINVSGEGGFPCPAIHYGELTDNLTIQQQLEVYISNKTSECVNFSIFENIGYNITIINKPNTTLTFGKEGFTVQTTYPFKVRIKGESRTAFADFEVRKKIMLKELYKYLYNLIMTEYQDLFFDIDRKYKFETDYNPAYSIMRWDNPCFHCSEGYGKYDNLFIVIDNRSEIRGKPLIFNLAIKNRVPALDFYSTGNAVYNIVAMEGSLINITPYGKDPDETPEKLFYNYSGWKEDYDEWFNESCCVKISGGCNVNNIKTCMVYNATFNNSCCAITSSCLTNPSVCVIINSKSPRNWSNSADYKNSKMNASYKTNRYDIGLHHLILSVEDEEGLRDFQNLSIIVYDIPIPIPNGSHNYTDSFLNHQNASIEDKYILYSLKYSIMTNMTEFEWNDTIEGWTHKTYLNETIIPDDIIGAPADIIGIINDQFTLFNRSKKESIHNLTLKGKYDDAGDDKWTTGNLFQVQVNLCLPHRNKSTASYPYNNLSKDFFVGYKYSGIADPFQADHTCCDENHYPTGDSGYIYMPNTTLCFSYTEYGDFKAMRAREQMFNKSGNGLPTSMVITPPGTKYTVTGRNLYNGPLNTQTNNNINDIFKRVFERSCSGDRGNICNGSITETFIQQEACDQNGIGVTGQSETCSGPGIPNVGNYIVKNESFTCIDYAPGNSFEKAYGLNKSGTTTAANGTCNQNKKCSKPSSVGSGYKSSGAYLCIGTCDGGSCGYARDQDCTCSKSTCGADSLCDGLKATELPKPLNRCYATTYYLSECSKNSCQPVNVPSPTFKCSGALDCSCDPKCDGKTSGYNLGCNAKTGGKSFLLDECSTDGTVNEETTCASPSLGTGCTGDSQCNEKTPGYKSCISGTKKTNWICDNTCKYIVYGGTCHIGSCGASCETNADCTDPSKPTCNPNTCACV